MTKVINTQEFPDDLTVELKMTESWPENQDFCPFQPKKLAEGIAKSKTNDKEVKSESTTKDDTSSIESFEIITEQDLSPAVSNEASTRTAKIGVETLLMQSREAASTDPIEDQSKKQTDQHVEKQATGSAQNKESESKDKIRPSVDTPKIVPEDENRNYLLQTTKDVLNSDNDDDYDDNDEKEILEKADEQEIDKDSTDSIEQTKPEPLSPHFKPTGFTLLDDHKKEEKNVAQPVELIRAGHSPEQVIIDEADEDEYLGRQAKGGQDSVKVSSVPDTMQPPENPESSFKRMDSDEDENNMALQYPHQFHYEDQFDDDDDDEKEDAFKALLKSEEKLLQKDELEVDVNRKDDVSQKRVQQMLHEKHQNTPEPFAERLLEQAKSEIIDDKTADEIDQLQPDLKPSDGDKVSKLDTITPTVASIDSDQNTKSDNLAKNDQSIKVDDRLMEQSQNAAEKDSLKGSLPPTVEDVSSIEEVEQSSKSASALAKQTGSEQTEKVEDSRKLSLTKTNEIQKDTSDKSSKAIGETKLSLSKAEESNNIERQPSISSITEFEKEIEIEANTAKGAMAESMSIEKKVTPKDIFSAEASKPTKVEEDTSSRINIASLPDQSTARLVEKAPALQTPNPVINVKEETPEATDDLFGKLSMSSEDIPHAVGHSDHLDPYSPNLSPGEGRSEAGSQVNSRKSSASSSVLGAAILGAASLNSAIVTRTNVSDFAEDFAYEPTQSPDSSVQTSEEQTKLADEAKLCQNLEGNQEKLDKFSESDISMKSQTESLSENETKLSSEHISKSADAKILRKTSLDQFDSSKDLRKDLAGQFPERAKSIDLNVTKSGPELFPTSKSESKNESDERKVSETTTFDATKSSDKEEAMVEQVESAQLLPDSTSTSSARPPLQPSLMETPKIGTKPSAVEKPAESISHDSTVHELDRLDREPQPIRSGIETKTASKEEKEPFAEKTVQKAWRLEDEDLDHFAYSSSSAETSFSFKDDHVIHDDKSKLENIFIKEKNDPTSDTEMVDSEMIRARENKSQDLSDNELTGSDRIGGKEDDSTSSTFNRSHDKRIAPSISIDFSDEDLPHRRSSLSSFDSKLSTTAHRLDRDRKSISFPIVEDQTVHSTALDSKKPDAEEIEDQTQDFLVPKESLGANLLLGPSDSDKSNGSSQSSLSPDKEDKDAVRFFNESVTEAPTQSQQIETKEQDKRPEERVTKDKPVSDPENVSDKLSTTDSKAFDFIASDSEHDFEDLKQESSQLHKSIGLIDLKSESHKPESFEEIKSQSDSEKKEKIAKEKVEKVQESISSTTEESPQRHVKFYVDPSQPDQAIRTSSSADYIAQQASAVEPRSKSSVDQHHLEHRPASAGQFYDFFSSFAPVPVCLPDSSQPRPSSSPLSENVDQSLSKLGDEAEAVRQSIRTSLTELLEKDSSQAQPTQQLSHTTTVAMPITSKTADVTTSAATTSVHAESEKASFASEPTTVTVITQKPVDSTLSDLEIERELKSWGKPQGRPRPLPRTGFPRPLGRPSPLQPQTSSSTSNANESRANTGMAGSPLVQSSVSVPRGRSLARTNPALRTVSNDTSQNTGGSSATPSAAVHFDLAFIGGDQNSSSAVYFGSVRSNQYVLSAANPCRAQLDQLLDARLQMGSNVTPITLVPSHESDVLSCWMADRQAAIEQAQIEIAPSASRCTVTLLGHENESCASYRLQF